MARLFAASRLFACLSLVSCGPPPDPLEGVTRQYATTCRPTGAPTAAPKLKLTRYLSGATLPSPMQMLPARDGTRAVFIVTQRGVIFRADDVTLTGGATPWLDLSDHVTSGGEMGLLSMALDPQFQANGRFYVNYTLRTNGQLQTRVSRLRVAAPPRGLPDAKTEQVLLTINQPYDNHNGGQIAFGPDGYLYVGMGDGGSGGDPGNNAQRMDSLLGKMLRIDVSGDGAAYRIPADNPFYTGQPLGNGTSANNSHCQSGGKAAVCGEIWASGLRNPWRFSFDPLNGTLWAGDVGQGAWEEVDVIERGKNYGWKCLEGTHTYVDTPECRDKIKARAFTAPLSEYSHDNPREGLSITGGFVYRGRALPGLKGTYVFGDYVSGTVWGLSPAQSGSFSRMTLLPEAVANISAFGTDADDELYVLEYGSGKILRVEESAPGMAGPPGWPERLSETGCFSDVAARRLAPGALPYDVTAPLWSDGADKERALVLPEGGVMGYRDSGTWELPEGTVLIKTFAFGGRPVETRLLIYRGQPGDDPGTVRGASYRWSEDGRDAVLLSAGLTARVGTGAEGRDWAFPSRADCVACHTRAAGGVLGLQTAQLNRRHDLFGTGEVEQVRSLQRVGYLAGVPEAPALESGGIPDPQTPAADLPRFPPQDDESVDLEGRARAYLHGNCAHCHQPGALSNATIDVRSTTSLAMSKACGVLAQQGDLGVRGARVIAPGKPEESTLLLRMATRDAATRMPSIGSLLVDPAGTALLRQWIAGLQGCP